MSEAFYNPSIPGIADSTLLYIQIGSSTLISISLYCMYLTPYLESPLDSNVQLEILEAQTV